MNYLDLFSGIGGFHEGLEEAGFKFEWSGHSEIDKYAKSIYQKHFPLSEDLGDVSNINVQDLPRAEKWIITGGWPCQDNSIAGKRKGQSGSTRSGLLSQIIRLIRELIEVGSEVVFIGENVKGLFSVNDGVDFLDSVRGLTYLDKDSPQLTLEMQLLNTRWFLPQNRERIYFIGYTGKRSGQQIFPIGESNRLSKQKRTGEQGKEVVTTVRAGMSGIPGNSETYVAVVNTREGLKETKDESLCIDRNYHKGMDNHGQRTMIQVGIDIANTLNCDGYLERGARGRDENGKTYLTGQSERRIRRFIPIECERLQGFEDDWTKYGKDGEIISDTQRYKTLGNAVSVPVVRAVGERLNEKR